MVDEQRVTRQAVTTTPTGPYYGAPVAGEAVTTQTVTRSPSTAELVRRVVVFLFALIQAVIALRIVLLLIDASRGNGIVNFIYSTSSLFVDPFNGIVRTDALQSGGSVLDIAAIVALIGWTIVELIVIAAVNISRREP